MGDARRRRELILQSLAEDGACAVSLLAKRFDVTTMTIRRDLDRLAESGKVRLYHGVAMPAREEGGAQGGYELVDAETVHVAEKQRIAKAAAALVEPNDILFIDGGSTAALIARHLPRGIPLTAICLSLNAFLNAKGNPDAAVILAGGVFHDSSQIFEGPESIELVKRYRATKAFISANGFREDLGVTCANNYLLAIKQAALSSSIQKILVADSSKFGKVNTCYFADLDDFDLVLTDNGLPADAAASIRGRGIRLEAV